MTVRNELPDESSAMLISIMKLEMSSICEIQNIQDNMNWLWYFTDALHSTQERWSKDAGKLAACALGMLLWLTVKTRLS